jgi:hypothetical protein
MFEPRRAASLAIGPCIIAGALLATAPASAQGLFEFLFGGAQRGNYERSVVAYAPDPGLGHSFRFAPDRRLERKKRVKLSPSITKAVEVTSPKKEPPPVAGPGPLGPFVNDPTLRAGDVVVTTQGLMVYRGGGGARHTTRDFVGIARAGKLVGRNQDLASIERANRRGQADTTIALTHSVEASKQANADGGKRQKLR